METRFRRQSSAFICTVLAFLFCLAVAIHFTVVDYSSDWLKVQQNYYESADGGYAVNPQQDYGLWTAWIRGLPYILFAGFGVDAAFQLLCLLKKDLFETSTSLWWRAPVAFSSLCLLCFAGTQLVHPFGCGADLAYVCVYLFGNSSYLNISRTRDRHTPYLLVDEYDRPVPQPRRRLRMNISAAILLVFITVVGAAQGCLLVGPMMERKSSKSGTLLLLHFLSRIGLAVSAALYFSPAAARPFSAVRKITICVASALEFVFTVNVANERIGVFVAPESVALLLMLFLDAQLDFSAALDPFKRQLIPQRKAAPYPERVANAKYILNPVGFAVHVLGLFESVSYTTYVMLRFRRQSERNPMLLVLLLGYVLLITRTIMMFFVKETNTPWNADSLNSVASVVLLYAFIMMSIYQALEIFKDKDPWSWLGYIWMAGQFAAFTTLPFLRVAYTVWLPMQTGSKPTA